VTRQTHWSLNSLLIGVALGATGTIVLPLLAGYLNEKLTGRASW
jgi:hypothetical protein